jgi:polyribonucleotide nucleotidyltransferase
MTGNALIKLDDYVKVGDILKVKLIEIDTKNGKLKLSRKALLPKPEGKPQEQTKKAEFKKK